MRILPLLSGTEEALSTSAVDLEGDVQGTTEICESTLWKKVVLCDGGVQWTMENTAVACREQGYPAPGQVSKCFIELVVSDMVSCSLFWNS